MEENYKNTHNPVLPLEYHIPDGEAHVMPDGRLYIYGSYDKYEDKFCSTEYHVASTPDLENWTVYDTALDGKDIPWFNNPDAPHYEGIDWSRPTPFIKKMMETMEVQDNTEEEEKLPLLFAPDAAYRNGKYYLYFCMSDDSEGVAVSDRPQGPFTDPVQLPCGGIDPAVFIDDDGQAYFYWGQLYANGVKLNPDMVSFDETQIVRNILTEQEHYFHEGSSMRKIGDTYYYVFADIEHGKATSLGYATGKSPLGPFMYRGVIIDNDPCDPESWNNHGSIECVNGQWYVFYHRNSRGGLSYRRLCMEPITILEDGTIPEVKMTSQGPGQPFGDGEKIYGYQACEVSGKTCVNIDGEGSEWLDVAGDGDTAVFRYVECENGFGKAVFETRGKGEIQILFDGKEAGCVKADDSGKAEIRFRKPVSGKHEMILRFLHPENLKVVSICLSSL